jgi:multidrug efflux pump subunit AcrB
MLLTPTEREWPPTSVFAAAPYGAIGALIALAIMGTPFGFMAFLGVASLIGVIVSHVIVLFDFIEEMHEKGEPLERALPDAGIERIRPVMIIVGATILALFPLALEGGPLWKPLCYAQIGGLAVATFITLLLVPVFYSIFVLDLDQMGNGREPEGTGGSIISDGLDSALRRGPPECWPCNMKIAFEKEPQNE